MCVEASRLNLEAMMFVDGVPSDRNTFPWDKSKDLAKQTATRNSSKIAYSCNLQIPFQHAKGKASFQQLLLKESLA